MSTLISMYACSLETDIRSHYTWLWGTMWLLKTELRTSGRAGSALHPWPISPAQTANGVAMTHWTKLLLAEASQPSNPFLSLASTSHPGPSLEWITGLNKPPSSSSHLYDASWRCKSWLIFAVVTLKGTDTRNSAKRQQSLRKWTQISSLKTPSLPSV